MCIVVAHIANCLIVCMYKCALPQRAASARERQTKRERARGEGGGGGTKNHIRNVGVSMK